MANSDKKKMSKKILTITVFILYDEFFKTY